MTGYPTIYLAGPMTGLPEFNRPAFNAAAAELRLRGFVVINPAEFFEGQTDLAWTAYMAHGMRRLVCDAHALAYLPGWRKSRGAKLEVRTAKAIGIEVKPWREFCHGR